MQPNWGNLVVLPRLPFPLSTAAPPASSGSCGVGSQEDMSLWTSGMFFLLSIVLPCPLCGLGAGHHQVTWQAFSEAGEHFRRELTRYKWLKLFKSFGISLDWPD